MSYPEPVHADWQIPPEEFESEMDRLNWVADAIAQQIVVDEKPPTKKENEAWLRRTARWIHSIIGKSDEDEELEAAARELGYDTDGGQWQDLRQALESVELDDIKRRAGIDQNSHC